ncbi:hypothetical protein [Kineothrix sedimenti]|uniref:Immunity protein 26 of polymorphic toxin system n=1 Tax=Kineothrix sedimenti TaxID=3123317 RepID=A0ABZ3EV28_9FIRM
MIGQINMFDIINPAEEIKEPPILLSIGQTVYKVLRGDVIKYTVYDEKSWICGDNDRGYRLKVKGGCYGVTLNSRLGIETFTEYKSAKEVAEAYINNHNVMIGAKIKASEVIAYRYIRECDNREMKAFYARIGSGLLYVKEFMTYEHIIDDTAKNIKKFMEQQEFKYDQPEQFDYIPKFKNMYPCRKDVDWMYAPAEYSGCI